MDTIKIKIIPTFEQLEKYYSLLLDNVQEGIIRNDVKNILNNIKDSI